MPIWGRRLDGILIALPRRRRASRDDPRVTPSARYDRRFFGIVFSDRDAKVLVELRWCRDSRPVLRYIDFSRSHSFQHHRYRTRIPQYGNSIHRLLVASRKSLRCKNHAHCLR